MRAMPVEHYLVGGERKPFLHVRCHIHAGRTPEQKGLLSEAVLVAVRDERLPVAVVTVEVVDMDRSSYAKHSH